MPEYPMPLDNPHCQCRGNPMKQMFCMTGHMTECHYPYSCLDAGCSHLTKYDLSAAEAAAAQARAAEKTAAGELPPYPLPVIEEYD